MRNHRAEVALASFATLTALTAATFVACGSTDGDGPTSGDGGARPDGQGSTGAPGNAAPAEGDASGSSDGDAASRCDANAPFQAPVALASLNTSGEQGPPSLSRDELTIYFDRVNDLLSDVYVATRPTTTEPFGAPAALSSVNSDNEDYDPAISADGSVLFLISDRATEGDFEMYMAHRNDGGGFATPTLVPNVNGSDPHAGHFYPFPLADGTALWFTGTNDGGSYQIFHSAWSGDSFAPPVAETELTVGSYASVLSPDTLTIFFVASGAPSGISVATRASASAPFSASAVVPGLSDGGKIPGWVSPDGCNLYFTSERSEAGYGSDLYVASRGR